MKKFLSLLLCSGTMLCATHVAHAQDSNSLTKLQLSTESDDSWKKHQEQESPKAAIQSLDSLSVSSNHNMILDSLKFCASTLDKNTRLSCYNDVAAKNGIEVKPLRGENDIAEANSHWIVKSNDNARDYIGVISSDTPIDDRGVKMSEPVSLYFRCSQGAPFLYFKSGMNIGKDPVAVTIMSNAGGDTSSAAGHYKFSPSKSGDAFGVWSRDAVIVLFSYLRDAGGIIMHYKVGDTPEISAKFDLSNMRAETGNISKACRI